MAYGFGSVRAVKMRIPPRNAMGQFKYVGTLERAALISVYPIRAPCSDVLATSADIGPEALSENMWASAQALP